MLPFLKPKTMAGIIIAKRKPDGGQTPMESQEESGDGLESAAADLISAIHAKDAKALASALRAAFQMLESEPHEEASFDEQNEAAASAARE